MRINTNRRDTVTSIQIKPPGNPSIALNLKILFGNVYLHSRTNIIINSVIGYGEGWDVSGLDKPQG